MEENFEDSLIKFGHGVWAMIILFDSLVFAISFVILLAVPYMFIYFVGAIMGYVIVLERYLRNMKMSRRCLFGS
jgi:type III secretory pathway component EscU